MSSEYALRVGFSSVAVLTGTPSFRMAIEFPASTNSEFASQLRKSGPITFACDAGATVFSTHYGVTGYTGVIDEGQASVRFDGGLASTAMVRYLDVEVSGLDAAPGASTEEILGTTTFEYSAGVLQGITYPDDSTKEFTYQSGMLMRVDHITTTRTKRTTFVYDIDGVLTTISSTVL
jgi:hypothetical protein